jgi:type II restriction enzyme
MQSRNDKSGGISLGFEEAQAGYESAPQIARVDSEGWMGRWAFCPSCGHEELNRQRSNSPASDFVCPKCCEEYELKSKRGRFGDRVVDGAYDSLCRRLSSDTNPNFAFMSYDRDARSVTNLFVVPKQFVHPAIIEKRRPLAPTARRAGWVGCNIRLSQVPSLGKVHVVRDGVVVDKNVVLDRWRQSLFLRDESAEARGWLVEVMLACDAIGAKEFTIEQVYAFENQLGALYPGNRNVRAKIRQQLQVLRDGDYLEFLGGGRYRLR